MSWQGVNKYRLNRETYQLRLVLKSRPLLDSFDNFFTQKRQLSQDEQQILISTSAAMPFVSPWKPWKMNPFQVLFYSPEVH